MCGFNEYSCFVGICDSLIDVTGEKMVHCVCVFFFFFFFLIKALTALVGRLSPSDCRLANGPEQGLKTVSFHP